LGISDLAILGCIRSGQEIRVNSHLLRYGWIYWIGRFFRDFPVCILLVREQAGLVVLPYGQDQGVLLDDNSINACMLVRGEPRSPIRKNQVSLEPKGDCVECSLCGQVCPTGIDIETGFKWNVELYRLHRCCDELMVKVDRPKGLIRYASENSIKQGFQKLITEG